MDRFLSLSIRGPVPSEWVVVLDTSILIGMEGFAGMARILPFWLMTRATTLLGAWLGSRSVPA